MSECQNNEGCNCDFCKAIKITDCEMQKQIEQQGYIDLSAIRCPHHRYKNYERLTQMAEIEQVLGISEEKMK
jgi:hypothetical protein